MTLTICSSDINDRQGTVIISGETQEIVQGMPARQLVLKEAAANGLARPGLSGGDYTYPVDAEGNTSDDLLMGRGTVAGYRCDYKVTGGL